MPERPLLKMHSVVLDQDKLKTACFFDLYTCEDEKCIGVNIMAATAVHYLTLL